MPHTPLDGALVAFAHAHPLPAWIRFSLPDARWQYAFGATTAAVWRGAPFDAKKAAFVVAPAALGILVELGQWAHVAEGTFDPVDLAASAAAASFAIAIHGELFVRGAPAARSVVTSAP